MAQYLYPVILAIIEGFDGQDRTLQLSPNWSEFSYSWTCVIILIITFLMALPRDISVYNKINSFGMFFFVLIILSIYIVGIDSILKTEYTHNKAEYEQYLKRREEDPSLPYLAYIGLWSESFGPLMGILGGAFYFHNIALSVVQDSRNPENSVRDVFVGYCLSFVTYVTCGVMGYYGFFGVEFESKLDTLDPPGDGQV